MTNIIDEALRHADIDLSILLSLEGEIPSDVRDELRKTLDLIDQAKRARAVEEGLYVPTLDEAHRFIKSNPKTSAELLREVRGADQQTGADSK